MRTLALALITFAVLMFLVLAGWWISPACAAQCWSENTYDSTTGRYIYCTVCCDSFGCNRICL